MKRANIEVKPPETMLVGISDPAIQSVRESLRNSLVADGMADVVVSRCGKDRTSPEPDKLVVWVGLQDVPRRDTCLAIIATAFMHAFGADQATVLIDTSSGQRLEPSISQPA